jgi:hypothetical protein
MAVMPKLTRRSWMQIALAAGAPAQAPAQSPTSENTQKLAAVKVPRDTEPAIVFRA